MKIVIILRGPSGIGKSTLAKNIPLIFGESALEIGSGGLTTEDLVKVCSADKYFVGAADGVYRFDPTRLGEAHGQCQKEFQDALNDHGFYGPEVIVVDNTNLRYEEWRHYYDLARTCGALPMIVNVEPRNGDYVYRSQHGIPEAGWRRQIQIYKEEKIPFAVLSRTIYVD